MFNMGTKEIRAKIAAGGIPEAKKLATKEQHKFNTMYLRGVGSALQYISIHEYYASSCGGCHTTAKEMDKLKPDDILNNIDMWAEKLHQNAQEKLWSRMLDMLAYTISGLDEHRKLIRRAVQAHLDEVSRKSEYTTQR